MIFNLVGKCCCIMKKKRLKGQSCNSKCIHSRHNWPRRICMSENVRTKLFLEFQYFFILLKPPCTLLLCKGTLSLLMNKNLWWSYFLSLMYFVIASWVFAVGYTVRSFKFFVFLIMILFPLTSSVLMPMHFESLIPVSIISIKFHSLCNQQSFSDS